MSVHTCVSCKKPCGADSFFCSHCKPSNFRFVDGVPREKIELHDKPATNPNVACNTVGFTDNSSTLSGKAKLFLASLLLTVFIYVAISSSNSDHVRKSIELNITEETWSSIKAQSVAQGSNPRDLILSISCEGKRVAGSDTWLRLKGPDSRNKIRFIFRQREFKEFSNYLPICHDTSVRQALQSTLTYFENDHSSTTLSAITTTTSTWPSIQILTWPEWAEQAKLLFTKTTAANSYCGASMYANDLYDLGNSAPDDTGTIAADLNEMWSILQWPTDSQNECRDMQNSFSEAMRNLNNDLSNLGQPPVS